MSAAEGRYLVVDEEQLWTVAIALHEEMNSHLFQVDSVVYKDTYL